MMTGVTRHARINGRPKSHQRTGDIAMTELKINSAVNKARSPRR
jgi:hypothetical protein